MRERFQVFQRIAKANDDAIEIGSAEAVNEVIESAQEIIDTILHSHDADVADDRFAYLPESPIRLNGSHHAVEVQSIADDGDTRFRHAAAFSGNLLVRFVGYDDAIGGVTA